MKAIAFAFALLSSTASAQEMSPVGCNALSSAATDAADKLDQVLKQMGGEAFRKAIPVMPEKAKPAASDVEDARVSAQMALQEYQHALKDFGGKIRNCGE